jgi:hypothetical protein
MLGTTLEEQQQHLQHEQQPLEQEAGMGMENELGLEEESPDTHPLKMAAAGEVTPAGLSRSASHLMMESVGSSAKRRGRPRGWTDARIHTMLTYLERNMALWKEGNLYEFYGDLCSYLGLDPSEAVDIQEKCEKMIKKYESDRRRGDASWKWFGRLNQVFDGPAIPTYPSMHRVDDDAASSSLDSLDEDDETGEKKSPFHDRLEHEKLLLKLKRLKSKTEMRCRDFEAAAEKQRAAFEELKAKTAHAIARLEKSIINAGYLLDQSEEMMAQQEQAAAHQQELGLE